MEFKELLQEKLNTQFPEMLIFTEFCGELTVTVPKAQYFQLCSVLKSDADLQFTLLEDLTAIDWATRKNRFSVSAHIFSIANCFRLVVKTTVEERDCTIESVSSIWKTADWHERETYDMYGITFTNHPDLRRMYMPEEFEYHPLRKEFPLMGIPGSLPLPKK